MEPMNKKMARLLQAAKRGNLQMLKTMAKDLARGNDLKATIALIHNEVGETALHLASREGKDEICQYLIEDLGFDPDLRASSEKEAYSEKTPLICSTERGSVSTMKYLIEKGANLNARDGDGLTPLHTAVIRGRVEALRVLLASKGAEVDAHHPLGTPLLLATAKDNDTMLNILLDHKADPHINYNNIITPLVVSVLNGSLKCTQLLIKAGADVNKQPVVDMALGSKVLLKYLLQSGADPKIPNKYGEYPLDVAAIRGLREASLILFDHVHSKSFLNKEEKKKARKIIGKIKKRSFINEEKMADLKRAIKELKIKYSCTQLLKKADVNKQPVLEMALGSEDLLNYLLVCAADDRVDPNIANKDGKLPIEVAAIRGSREAVKILFPLTSPIEAIPDWTIEGLFHYVESQSFANKPDYIKYKCINPLAVSAKSSYKKCIQLLIMAGVDVNKQPVLHVALGSVDLLNYLLRYGADPNIPNKYGVFPIEAAAIRGLTEAVQILFPLTSPIGTVPDWTIEGLFQYVESQSFTNKPDYLKYKCITPLDVSAHYSYMKCIQLLIKAGADVNKQPVLHVALGSVDLMNYLLRSGADPNIPNKYGVFPIEAAANRGLTEAVQILFPLTSPLKTIPNWTIEGLSDYVKSTMELKGEGFKKKEKMAMKEVKIRQGCIIARYLCIYVCALQEDPSDVETLANRAVFELEEVEEEDQEVRPILDSEICSLQKILGYRFSVKVRLDEGVTHFSYYKSQREVPSYYEGQFERYELQGDSAVAEAVAHLLVKMYHNSLLPELTPAKLRQLKSANTCNELFARLAITTGIYKFFRHNLVGLQKDKILNFCREIVEYPNLPFGLVNTPKPLADFVEAILGAIYKDSGKSNRQIEKVFRRLVDPMITPDDLSESPTDELKKYCKSFEPDDFEIRKNRWEEEGIVEILFEEKVIASSTYRQKKSVCVNRACSKALLSMKEIKKELEKINQGVNGYRRNELVRIIEDDNS